MFSPWLDSSLAAFSEDYHPARAHVDILKIEIKKKYE